MADMGDAPLQEATEATPLPHLRFLKGLVTVLAGTMIIGLITIVALFVIRFPKDLGASRPSLPANIALPQGAKAGAVTLGRGWIAVVTDANDILIFDAASGTLTQTVHITTQP